jgi:hypothetical protein
MPLSPPMSPIQKYQSAVDDPAMSVISASEPGTGTLKSLHLRVHLKRPHIAKAGPHIMFVRKKYLRIFLHLLNGNQVIHRLYVKIPS